jgi:hypothetical protein
MADQINTFQEEAPESTEHQQAMLDRERGAEVDESRPEWLPEKFKSVEDMAKAYASLESKLGQGTQEEVTEEAPTENPTEVAELLDSKGLDFSEFQQEYYDNGTLSDDAYVALEEAGFPPSMVDSWIAGQDALAAQQTGEMYSLVGGAEEYATMVQWARDTLPPEEVDAYNATMSGQSPSVIRMAVQGLFARYRSMAEPNLIQGGTSSASTGGKFESTAQMTAAMRDPRYANDPAYRQAVATKLQKSSLF